MRILVVEDEAINRDLFHRILRRAHDVVVVETGAEALAALEGGGFDLVLTDQGLRDEVGSGLASVIRARWSNIKLMIVTGCDTDPLVCKAFATGQVDRVVAKPFRPAELHADIAALAG